jgi:hypothetical protein
MGPRAIIIQAQKEIEYINAITSHVASRVI